MQLWTREMAHYMAKMYEWNIRSNSRVEIDDEKLEARLYPLQRKLNYWIKQENKFIETLNLK